jgi:tight adherence protein C
MTFGVWGLLSALADRPSSAEERLHRVLNPAASQNEVRLREQQQAKFQKKVSDAASKIGRSLRPSNEVELGKIRLKLLNAGFRGEQAVMAFYGWKLMGLLVGLGIAVPICLARYGMTESGITYSILAGALGFYLPDLYVGQLRSKRIESIFLALPDALDLMVVCVEAGLGLDTAMRRVTAELSSNCPVLCEEFAIANFQVQMGRSRKDVLRDLGTRTGVEDMRALAAVIIQAEKFGSSIGGACGSSPTRCACDVANLPRSGRRRPRSRS